MCKIFIQGHLRMNKKSKQNIIINLEVVGSMEVS